MALLYVNSSKPNSFGSFAILRVISDNNAPEFGSKTYVVYPQLKGPTDAIISIVATDVDVCFGPPDSPPLDCQEMHISLETNAMQPDFIITRENDINFKTVDDYNKWLQTCSATVTVKASNTGKFVADYGIVELLILCPPQFGGYDNRVSNLLL